MVLPLLEKRILVEEQQEPVFVITGYSNLTRMVYEFERGLRVFHDIHIFARSQPLEETVDEDGGQDDRDKATNIAKQLSKSLIQREYNTKQNIRTLNTMAAIAV